MSDHNTTQRRAEFGLGSTTINERRRMRHRLAPWAALVLIAIAFVICGTINVWMP